MAGKTTHKNKTFGGSSIVTENAKKSVNFVRILIVLRRLRDDGIITKQEFENAKNYYRKATGADIYVVD